MTTRTALSVRLPSIIIPILIFILSFILRCALVTKGPYHGDSLDLVAQAQMTMETGQLQKHTPLGFPLMVILAGLFIKGAQALNIGDPFIVINFLSVAFSSLAVLVFYLLVKKLLDEPTAFFSAILLSISPMFLGVSVYGKNHAPSLYFFLQGLLFLFEHLERRDTKSLVLSGICVGLMGAIRFDVLLMFLPLSYLFFCGVNRDRNNKRVLYFWSIAALTMSFFYIPYLFHPVGLSMGGYGRYIQSDLLNNYLGLLSSRLFIVFNFFVQTLTFPGVIGSMVGLVMIWKQKKYLGWFLALWICAGVLFYGNLHFTVTPRYFVIVLPALIIGLGYFFGCCQFKNAKLRVLINLLFVVLVVRLFSDIYPVLKTRHDYALLPRFAEWVGKKTEANAVIITADEGGFIALFGKREVLGRPSGEPSNSYRAGDETLTDFKAKIDDLLTQHVPVYITDAALYAYNKDNYFVDFMNNHYRGDYVGRCLYEDWHGGELKLQVFSFNLYRIWPPGP